jgi:hypothetical protein
MFGIFSIKGQLSLLKSVIQKEYGKPIDNYSIIYKPHERLGLVVENVTHYPDGLDDVGKLIALQLESHVTQGDTLDFAAITFRVEKDGKEFASCLVGVTNSNLEKVQTTVNL